MLFKLDIMFPTARHHCNISSKEALLPGCNDVRWAPPTRYTHRRYTASIMKDLIYHIPVVFFQFIVFIVLTGGAEFTVWQNGAIFVNWKLTICLFSSWFILF